MISRRPDARRGRRRPARYRYLAATAAAGALILAATSAAGPSRASFPFPLPIPKPPSGRIPGEEVVTFKLVFEGTSNANRVVDVGGDLAVGCKAQLHEDIQEDVTFGRGRGVTMEFVRIKEGNNVRYGFQRAGRIGDSSFNVVAKIERSAQGNADILQDPTEPVACQPLQHYDLSTDPDCGKTITDNQAWGLSVERDHFVPRPATNLQGNFAGPDSCGKPPLRSAFATGGEEDLAYQWPTVAQLPQEPIPLHKIFDTRFHSFKVVFTTPKRKTIGTFGVTPLEGRVEDHGSAEATVRFIRQ